MSKLNTDEVEAIRERHKVTRFAYAGQRPPQAATDIATLLSLYDQLRAEAGRAIDFIQTEDGYDNAMELLCTIAGRPNRWPKDAKNVSVEEVARRPR